MPHHSFDERLRKFAHPWRGWAKFPEIIDLLRRFATLEVAPEMILNCRFAPTSSFAHNDQLRRRSARTFAISTAARAAPVPRSIWFSRQRARACPSLPKLSTTLMIG